MKTEETKKDIINLCLLATVLCVGMIFGYFGKARPTKDIHHYHTIMEKCYYDFNHDPDADTVLKFWYVTDMKLDTIHKVLIYN